MGALERHLKELHEAMQDCPAIVDATVLFRVWSKQRGLGGGGGVHGGFGGFHFAMLMAMLLSQRKLSRLMSSYQVLRIVLQHIGELVVCVCVCVCVRVCKSMSVSV